MQSITLYLPEAVMLRARQVANVLQRPVEEVLTATLATVLPEVDDAPPDMQTELVRMTWLKDQELWTIASSTMSEEQQERLSHLSDLQTQRPLTPEEQKALESLRREYGSVTLRKARAYALLSMRGGRPLLADD
jgi:hypothetical protein